MKSVRIYTFREKGFASAGDTVVSVAPTDAVASVYGAHEETTSGLSSAFGGFAIYSDDATGEQHIGVWGARKASSFRSSLRDAGLNIEIVNARPPGRLAWYETKGEGRKASSEDAATK